MQLEAQTFFKVSFMCSSCQASLVQSDKPINYRSQLKRVKLDAMVGFSDQNSCSFLDIEVETGTVLGRLNQFSLCWYNTSSKNINENNKSATHSRVKCSPYTFSFSFATHPQPPNCDFLGKRKQYIILFIYILLFCPNGDPKQVTPMLSVPPFYLHKNSPPRQILLRESDRPTVTRQAFIAEGRFKFWSPRFWSNTPTTTLCCLLCKWLIQRQEETNKMLSNVSGEGNVVNHFCTNKQKNRTGYFHTMQSDLLALNHAIKS